MIKTRKKLIEVALPLVAINEASAKEKSIRHGHPSTLHLWWARRPLATARAVIFSQMVDDPSSLPEQFPTKEEQDKERQRLFDLIEDLVKWENTTNEVVLEKARKEIWKSWRVACDDNRDHPQAEELFNPEKLPAFHDPFAGGGALPLEAQRLGLESYASDLNPVAVLINKAMIEIPPKFAGQPPVNPEASSNPDLYGRKWKGAEGLAEDVRYYGNWMRDEAEKRIGHLYPKIRITEEITRNRSDLLPYLNRELEIIAWIWVRTVKSPNPVYCNQYVPLASTFILSNKKGKEVYVKPVIEGDRYSFVVKKGVPHNLEEVGSGTKLLGANFKCLISGSPISADYLKEEGKTGGLNARLMAVIAKGDKGRVYLSPLHNHEMVIHKAKPDWLPEGDVPKRLTGGTCVPYGLTKWENLFSSRQLVALTTFSDILRQVEERIHKDAVANNSNDSHNIIDNETNSVTEYSNAVNTYLAIAINKTADRNSTICTWDNTRDSIRNTFGRQAIPMTWDYAESNPFSGSTGSIINACAQICRFLVTSPSQGDNRAFQADAQTQSKSRNKVVSTDPPYYDNIGYADLSDFFYVWLRVSLKPIYPELLATLAVPKNEELVAAAYRHGGKGPAEEFFLDGMTQAMHRLADQAQMAYPVTIYYAFKQSERKGNSGTASTGWETFLEAVIQAGFSICGTWPMRTELKNRMISAGTNALASSIVLVCRKQKLDSQTVTRRDFVSTLKIELPKAITQLQVGNIAPVDLAQSSIGPGMSIFTRYSKILEADDSTMTVRTALQLINEVLDDYLSEREGAFDSDTRFATTWFENHKYESDAYGEAEVLANARNVSVQGIVEAGVIQAMAGKVRLLKRSELPDGWDPAKDTRLTVWEATQHLIKRQTEHGETAAADLLTRLGSTANQARDLAYRLYQICERKGWAEEARAYNGLVIAWPELEKLTSKRKSSGEDELTLEFDS
ncbi:hypothetical protein BMS3Bbin04_00073 [bacterium BMS3Bbin04]|nr:hypothetical protein BMS3Bbin04_00073 [bacterium BMS3Bbin04]